MDIDSSSAQCEASINKTCLPFSTFTMKRSIAPLNGGGGENSIKFPFFRLTVMLRGVLIFAV